MSTAVWVRKMINYTLRRPASVGVGRGAQAHPRRRVLLSSRASGARTPARSPTPVGTPLCTHWDRLHTCKFCEELWVLVMVRPQILDTQKWTVPPLLDMAVLMVPLALSEMELLPRYELRSCAIAPPAHALAKAVTPASPILLSVSQSSCKGQMWHTKQDCQAWRTRMSNLKAWDQSTEAPTCLQLRHGPTGAGVG